MKSTLLGLLLGSVAVWAIISYERKLDDPSSEVNSSSPKVSGSSKSVMEHDPQQSVSSENSVFVLNSHQNKHYLYRIWLRQDDMTLRGWECKNPSGVKPGEGYTFEVDPNIHFYIEKVQWVPYLNERRVGQWITTGPEGTKTCVEVMEEDQDGIHYRVTHQPKLVLPGGVLSP